MEKTTGDKTDFEEEIIGPELLSIPPKLQPIITRFNDYKIFIIEGGRGSAKTHTVGRILTYIAEKRIVRIFCGREIQATIEESVYTLFCDLIQKYSMAYRVTKSKISSLLSGSTLSFKGFRERGAINIKGIEGADIVWVDEAQALTKLVLDNLLPTLRKETPIKFIFTLNRLFRDDAVMDLASRDDCLHIHIDYFENPFCPATLLDEAERCRLTNPRDYNHIWLGQPASASDEYIFDFDKLYATLTQKPFGECFYRQRVIGIDWAAQGKDLCVATILDRKSSEHWSVFKQISWDEPNTTISVGKIIALIAEYSPDVIVLDIGGSGYNVYCDLVNAKIKNIYPFDGASTDGIGPRSLNLRAEGYWNLRDWLENGFICMDEIYRSTLKQCEKLKQVFRPDGKRQVEEKKVYKKREGFSPDEADSIMMAVYGCRFLGASRQSSNNSQNGVQRKTGAHRRR